jgi:hypothetical protein
MKGKQGRKELDCLRPAHIAISHPTGGLKEVGADQFTEQVEVGLVDEAGPQCVVQDSTQGVDEGGQVGGVRRGGGEEVVEQLVLQLAHLHRSTPGPAREGAGEDRDSRRPGEEQQRRARDKTSVLRMDVYKSTSPPNQYCGWQAWLTCMR